MLSWLLCGQWDDTERGNASVTTPIPHEDMGSTHISPRSGAITDTVPHLSWIQRYLRRSGVRAARSGPVNHKHGCPYRVEIHPTSKPFIS